MSRILPPRPNLEHLRNQAKDLLRSWQREKPDAQLADAQHAIARDHGFASWPKLKMHVESLSVAGSPSGLPIITEHPLAGTWTADIARSTRHPANLFQRAVLHIAVAGDTVTITHSGVGAAGQPEHSETRIQADGQEHRSAPGSEYLVIATWRGSRVLETVAKRGGNVVGGGTYEVSADGQTLTVSTLMPGANADGWRTDFEQRIAFDRS
jgi:hypothetical protein